MLKPFKTALLFIVCLICTAAASAQRTQPAPTGNLTVSGTATYAAGGEIVVGRQTAECTPANCTRTFQASGPVTIYFKPNQHSTFGQFLVDGKICPDQANNSCKVTVDKPTKVTFGVLPKKYEVTVTFPPEGSIKPIYYETPNGLKNSCINTGKPCKFSWEAGRPLNVTAEPSAQYELDQWTGMCQGAGCSTTLTQDTYLGMKLRLRKFTLSLSVVGGAAGKVYTQPPGINCSAKGGQCTAKYTPKDLVTLFLEPDGPNVEGVFGLKMCEQQKTPNRCTLGLGADMNMTIIFKNK